MQIPQAIELSQDALTNVKFIQEKKLIQMYFDQISQDTGRYCFGVVDTFKALEMGAVETLIVWENLELNRYVFTHLSTGGRAWLPGWGQQDSIGVLRAGARCPAAAGGSRRPVRGLHGPPPPTVPSSNTPLLPCLPGTQAYRRSSS